MRSHDRDQLEAWAKDALGSLEPIRMTDPERSRLRQAVWSELRSPAPERARTGLSWRTGLVGATAALAVVLGAVGLYGGGLLGEADIDTGFALRSSSGQDEPFGASPTTIAAGTDATLTAETNSDDGEELDPIANPPDLVDHLRREAELIRNEVRAHVSSAESEAACAALPELAGLALVTEVTVEGTTYGAWAPDGAAIGPDTPITFVETATCTIVATIE